MIWRGLWLAGVVALAVGVTAARGDELQDAREHYRRATKAYEVGQYDEAIAEFATAYKLKDDPSILFNLAQSHRLAGHRAEALRTYRMFLVKVPSAPNRHEVEAMINTLQQEHPGSSEDPDRELARRYAEAGATKFAAQQYQEALVEFEKARLVRPTPGLDLNIARCYDRLGRLEEALASYRIYIEAKPEPADATEMRSRISVLEERLAASHPSESATSQPAPPAVAPVAAPPPVVDEHAGRGKTIAGIVVAAVGLGALAGGIACGVLAQQNATDLTNLDKSMGTFSPSKESAGKNDQLAEGVLLGVGGVAVVAGVVLVVLGRRASRRAPVALLPAVGPGRAGAVVEWNF